MSFWKKSIAICICLCAWYSPAFSASADISFSINPENPKPYEVVTVGLESLGESIDSAKITWKINDKLIAEGIGTKSIRYRSGRIGSIAQINATIAGELGTYSKTITLTTSDVDILWEAQSYTPPFYKGKALPGEEALIKLTAIPNTPGLGNTIKMRDFVYTWKRNGDSSQSNSGYGKSSMKVTLDYLLKTETISVDVAGNKSGYSGSSEVALTPVSPQILFYRKTPDLGTQYQQTITDGFGFTGDTTIVAAPYYISPKSLSDKNLSLSWETSDYVQSQSRLPHEISFIAEGNTANSLTFSVLNGTKLFQEIKRTLRLTL